MAFGRQGEGALTKLLDEGKTLNAALAVVAWCSGALALNGGSIGACGRAPRSSPPVGTGPYSSAPPPVVALAPLCSQLSETSPPAIDGICATAAVGADASGDDTACATEEEEEEINLNQKTSAAPAAAARLTALVVALLAAAQW